MRLHSTRRRASAAVFFLCAALAGCPPPGAEKSAPSRLVLLVTIDTLRADRLSCYGGNARTPAIDALAASGLRYESAYSPCPLTGPSHASLFSGMAPPEHGVRDNGVRLPTTSSFPWLAEDLTTAGFETAAFVGAAPLDERLGFSRGFSTYDGRFETRPGSPKYAERSALAVTAAASRFVGARARTERPLFLWLHFFDPHAPYEPPPPFDRAVDPYEGEISSVDAALHEFLSLLRLLRLLGPESLVVVTSDHGESLGEHGEATHGLLLHDATLRVPLVVSGAGIEAGVVKEPVSLLDVAPTILEFAGAKPRSDRSGLPLARAGSSPRSPARDFYAESYYAYFRYRWAGQRSIRAGDLKWIDGGPDRALFDTATDPGERENEATRRSADAERLAARLAETERSFAPPPPATPFGVLNLEALSYVGNAASSRESASLPPSGNDRLPGVAGRLPLVARLEEALRRLDAHDAATARDIAASVLEADPSNPDAALLLGRSERDLAQTGDRKSFTRAVEALERAISLRPTDPAPRNVLIQTLARAERDADALAAADDAEAALAADASTAVLAGELLIRPGSPVFDPEAAVRRFRLALERDPDHPVAHERLRSKTNLVADAIPDSAGFLGVSDPDLAGARYPDVTEEAHSAGSVWLTSEKCLE